MKIGFNELLKAIKTKQTKHDLFCGNCMNYKSLWCNGECPLINIVDDIDNETLLNIFADNSSDINKVKKYLTSKKFNKNR